jgi:hypothetical protein
MSSYLLEINKDKESTKIVKLGYWIPQNIQIFTF